MASNAAVDRDLSLLGLAERVERYTGRIEDMPDDERVFVLGLFAGAVSRLEARVRELYAEDGRNGYTEGLSVLHQVMLALGAPEGWNEPGDGTA